LKNVKELKESLAPRMRRCWGESCAIFVISAGGYTAAVFAWYLAMDFLISVNVIEKATDGFMLVVTAAIIVVMWIITLPYKYGVRWYRLQQVRGHSVHAKSIFSCYFSAKKMLQVYRLSIMLFLKKTVLLIPLVILIGTGIFLIIRFNTESDSIIYNLVVGALLTLSVVVYIVYTIINVQYAAAPYLFALGHDRPAGEIIKESVCFMRGNHAYMVAILRNCALMLIPCVMIFPMFFVLPKMMMLYTGAINEIIENGFEQDRLISMERREKVASR